MAAKISQANALKLSAWLATQHPQFFRRVLQQTQALQRSPLGRLGYFGDDSGLTDITVTDSAPAPDFSSVSFSTPDVAMQSISMDTSAFDTSSVTDAITNAVSAPPMLDSSVADTSQSAPSFWSNIGSGASSIASSIGKVAGALASPAVLSTVANAANTYFAAQGQQAQAQVIQAQAARVAQGAAPAPISYVTNPATGQVTPVYNSNAGAQPLTGSLLNRLMQPTAAGLGGLPTSVWLIGGGLVAVGLVLTLTRR